MCQIVEFIYSVLGDLHTSWHIVLHFIRDGILSIADYNSTWMGFVVVVVVVVATFMMG